MRKAFVTLACVVLSLSVTAQNVTDTFRLYFDLDVATLGTSIENKIDRLIYFDKIMQKSDVKIIGYTDNLGTEGYNQVLSMQRAKNVKNYLVKNGIDAKNVKVCLGKGEIMRRGVNTVSGYPIDRRVDIVVNNKGRGEIKKQKPKPIVVAPPPIKKHSLTDSTTRYLTNITKYKPGQAFVLKNVYFYAERHTVRPESLSQVEALYNVLDDNPTLKIRIEGHVCCIHDAPDARDIDAHDLNLSVNRARAIYDYLVNKGIDPKRLKYAGFGKSRPVVVEEQTEADADKNRRVEIRILEN